MSLYPTGATRSYSLCIGNVRSSSIVQGRCSVVGWGSVVVPPRMQSRSRVPARLDLVNMPGEHTSSTRSCCLLRIRHRAHCVSFSNPRVLYEEAFKPFEYAYEASYNDVLLVQCSSSIRSASVHIFPDLMSEPKPTRLIYSAIPSLLRVRFEARICTVGFVKSGSSASTW